MFNLRLLIITLVTFIINIQPAFSEKKNPPKNDDVIEESLKLAGDTHFPEKFKFDDIGTIEHEETYYHSYIGYNDDGTYRVIFFDNKQQYLGYYNVDYEPVDYEDSAVLLDDESDGFFSVRLGKDGPNDAILIDGIKTTFIRNKKINKKEEAIKEKQIEKPQIIYRNWTIKRGGKSYNYECIFVKKVGSKIFLKEKSRGKTLPFSETELSNDDISYLKALEIL
mgnify:CR=1 FL=1